MKQVKSSKLLKDIFGEYVSKIDFKDAALFKFKKNELQEFDKTFFWQGRIVFFLAKQNCFLGVVF